MAIESMYVFTGDEVIATDLPAKLNENFAKTENGMTNLENRVIPIEKGGTGATTVAGARNNLGLGNTSGALPIANGGTGATSVAEARNNLGLGNTNGALPIANGGTGATNASGACANIDALPKSGGTMRNSILFDLNYAIKRNINNSMLIVMGGSQEYHCGAIKLWGEEDPSNGGRICLEASQSINGTAVKSQINIYPDGTTSAPTPPINDNSDKIATTAYVQNTIKDYIVETGKSSDGTAWYRKWKSGWLEQGGIIYGVVASSGYKSQIITLLKPFSNKDYCAYVTGSNATESSYGCNYVYNKTTTSFVAITLFINDASTPISWYVCGQGV